MSYTTTLYALDVDGLRAAIGSKDGELLGRVTRECLDESSGGRAVGKLLRVELDEEAAILVDGKRAEIEDVRRAVQKLTGTGDRVRMAVQDSKARKDLSHAILHTMTDMGTTSGRMPSYEPCRKEDLWCDDDEQDCVQEETGVRRLIFGELSGRETASDVAYALQHLCSVLGTELDTDDALGDLADLQIDSPLCNWRMPVDLSQPADFPFISYLNPEEVTTEVVRLVSMDVSFPGDEDIKYARKVFLRCLEEANRKSLSVVAFYY